MADEKKLKNEELNEEQLNEVAGGVENSHYRCERCRNFYRGSPYIYHDKNYCEICYRIIKKQ